MIDFIIKQKNQVFLKDVDAKTQISENKNFFVDEKKEIPDIEKILNYSFDINASDIHLQAGKYISYRVE